MKKPTPKIVFHTSRVFLFGLLAIALLVVQSSSSNAFHLTYQKDNVLAYASNMTISDLLKATNASRAEQGLAPLTLNNSLNTSAQLKANDMVAKNYWSHNSPDGIQPWYWFDKANYAYSIAGENLAYGFSTGKEVEAAWMNSPTHKANVLGDYEDVGFGIASSANFQGNANTVVVAHYGKPRSDTAVAPAQQTTAPGETTSTGATTEQPANTATSASVLGLIQNGVTPTFAMISIGLITLAAAGFGLTHRMFLKHALRESKQFAAHHPLIDAAAIFVTLGIVLTTTAGYLL